MMNDVAVLPGFRVAVAPAVLQRRGVCAFQFLAFVHLVGSAGVIIMFRHIVHSTFCTFADD